MIGLLAAASALLLVCLLAGGPGEVVFAVLAVLFPVALMALAVSRTAPTSDRRWRWPLSALAVALLASFLGMLALRGRMVEGPWLAGLPAALVLQLVGLLAVPLVIVALGHALTFKEPRQPKAPRRQRTESEGHDS